MTKREKRKPTEKKNNLPEEFQPTESQLSEEISIEEKTEDPVTMILNEIKKLGERQEKFEEQTVKMVDKQTDRLNSFANDIKNTPQSDMMMPPLPQSPPSSTPEESMKKDSDGNYIDNQGVSWGATIPKHLQGKRDEFSQGSSNQSQMGNMEKYIPYAFNLITAYIQRPQQGAMGQVFMEFVMRDFFENYQQTKLQQKANLNILVKKGLLSEEDVSKVNKNSDTLNDPLNKMIDNMKNPQPT